MRLRAPATRRNNQLAGTLLLIIAVVGGHLSVGVTPARADHFLGHVDCSDVANLNQFGECIGTGGTDLLDGEGHQDWTDGGNGDDYLYGYAGNDMLNGGRGRDVSEVADRGKDRIDCGKGKDKVVIDEADMVDDNCKRQIAVT